MDQVVDVLRKRGYIRGTKKLEKTLDHYVYNEHVEKAFNQFRRDAGLPHKHAADTASLRTLEGWGAMCSTLSLGDREIRYVNQDYGPDVAELIAILNSLGYGIDDAIVEYRYAQPVYTLGIMDAVIDFQTKNGLVADGVVNDKTAGMLKKKNQRK